MIYSELFVQNKKGIPTLIALSIIFFAVVLFLSLMKGTARYSRASKTNLKRIEITNINPIQLTVYWQSEGKEVGWIVYGESENSLSNISFDDRDVSEKKDSYFNHFVTIRNLKPGSHYFFAVVSGNQKIVRPDGSLFDFSTPVSSATVSKLEPASGKILNVNLTPLVNAVVLLTVDENTFLLSTLTKETGEWLIPLNSFYDKKTFSGKTFSGEEKAMVEIVSEEGKNSTITDKLKNLSVNTAAITIGENKNYLGQDNVLSATSSIDSSVKSDSPEIIYPKEGSLIPGRRPLIKGTALPETEVSILIQSKKVYSARVKADKKGEWSYLIPEDLDLGIHTISMTTVDKQEKTLTKTVRFTIVANEGLEGKVLGLASGEPTITLAPTLAPTIPYNPTTIPTATPPVSGISDSLPVISGLSLIILGGGILLVF